MSNLVLSKPQHTVLQKLGSHFGVSQKILRVWVDPNSLLDNVLYLPDMADSNYAFRGSFYCLDGKFNLGQVLDPAKFVRTALWQSWLNFTSGNVYKANPDVMMAYCVGGGAVLVIRQGISIDSMLGDKETGIILQHECLNNSPMFLCPIKSYLSNWYPSPPCE